MKRFISSTLLLVSALILAPALLVYLQPHFVYEKLVDRGLSRFTIGVTCLESVSVNETWMKKFGPGTANGLDKSKTKCDAHLLIHDPQKFYSTIVLGGTNIGIAEAYLLGHWSVPNSEKDEEAFSAVIYHLFTNRLHTTGWLNAIPEYVLAFQLLLDKWNRINEVKDRPKERTSVEYHYDNGVEIYQAFLDDPLMGGYTCGLWKHANDTLKQAQDHKWNNAIQRANITKEKHIIDIGSGWGYFPSYAHNRTGAKVTGITISQEQVDFSRLMYGHQAPNVNFELRDFRDLPKNTYDGAASVGVMAHVGTNLRPFLQSIYDSLKPGSIFHLEGIVMTDVYHKHEPWTRAKICKTTNFIVKYIFPQGCLLLRDWWIEAAEEIGFVLLYEERYGKHYARTLRNWRLNWEKNYPKLLAQDPKRFGDKFKFRMWQYYFAFCEAAFRVERIENVVLQLYKPVKVNSARWDNYRQFTVDPHTWPTNLKPEEPEKRRN